MGLGNLGRAWIGAWVVVVVVMMITHPRCIEVYSDNECVYPDAMACRVGTKH